MIIALTGFMGCGKSTTGRMLQKLVPDACLVDLDSAIEVMTGRKIAEIFANDGEAMFRELEAKTLRKVIKEHDDSGIMILSLGGGTLTTKECADIIRESTTCFYLKASIDTLTRNLLEDGYQSRPMMNGVEGEDAVRKRIEGLMAVRSSIYEENATVIINIDGKEYTAIAKEIISSAGL